jgi:hypothetical protein
VSGCANNIPLEGGGGAVSSSEASLAIDDHFEEPRAMHFHKHIRAVATLTAAASLP